MKPRSQISPYIHNNPYETRELTLEQPWQSTGLSSGTTILYILRLTRTTKVLQILNVAQVRRNSIRLEFQAPIYVHVFPQLYFRVIQLPRTATFPRNAPAIQELQVAETRSAVKKATLSIVTQIRFGDKVAVRPRDECVYCLRCTSSTLFLSHATR